MNEFNVLHKYRTLVDRGAAPELECRCGMRYIIEDSDGPVLFCMACWTARRLGAKEYDRIERVVREHFVDKD